MDFVNNDENNTTGKLLTNSMMMMVMMPLMTTISTKLVDFVITLLQIFGKFIIYLFSMFKNKYWKSKEYTIEVEIFNMSDAMINITKFGKAILWHLKKNNLKVSRKYMFLWNDILKNANTRNDDDDDDDDDQDEEDNRKTSEDKYLENEICLFMPIPVDYKKNIKDVMNNKNLNKNLNDKEEQQDDLGDADISTDFEYLENNIHVSISKRKKQSKIYWNVGITSVLLNFKSDQGLQHLEKYIIDVSHNYEKYIKTLENATNRYYGRMFLMNVRSDTNKNTITYTEYKYDKTQIFDDLFFEGKENLITQLDRLDDAEYFHKRGLKRKIALLICGPPGSGKTCVANAIANHRKLAIINAPIHRIKTNSDIEQILYSNSYNNETITNKEKITLFDEIDAFTNISMKKQEINLAQEAEIKKGIKEHAARLKTIIDKNKNDNNDNSIIDNPGEQLNDPFNVGSFLSLLDGVNDQDGMCVVATANNIDSLDPAIYRDGRLKLIELKYVGRNEIRQMIERYHSTVLTESQIERIRDDKIIQNLTIKNLCIDYVDKACGEYDDFKKNNLIDELIDKISCLEIK
jgi:SpoVK/Ycf46/Vps4 family AAA+-type ATPase